MTWNYRIIKHVQDDEVYYGVHEVFYNANRQPSGYSVQPVFIVDEVPGESHLLACRDVIAKILDGVNKPVLEEKDFPEPMDIEDFLKEA